MLYVRSETHLPATGHRTPYRSSTDTAARTPLLGTFVRVRHTGVGHGLGKPLLFMGIRGSNEAHFKNRIAKLLLRIFPVTEIMLWEGACIRKQCILSGGQCVPPSCCRYNSRSCARRSGSSSANASWTTGLFNSGFVSKSELIHTAGSTQTKTVTSM